MLIKNLFIPIPSVCFKNKNGAQKYLYQATTPLELKFIFALIAHAMMLRTVNKSNELLFSMSLKNISSKKGLFGSKKLSFNDVRKLLNNIEHPYIYIDHIQHTETDITYSLTDKYIQDLLEKYSHNKNISLSELMGYKNISAVKAHLQIAYFERYKISFFGAIEFFNISENSSRSNQLLAIKRILNSAKNSHSVFYFGETSNKNTRYMIETLRLDDYQFYNDLEITTFDDEH